MVIELSKEDLKVVTEKPLKVYYDDEVVGDFYVDLFVNEAANKFFAAGGLDFFTFIRKVKN